MAVPTSTSNPARGLALTHRRHVLVLELTRSRWQWSRSTCQLLKTELVN
jgi:hypothetical protein